MTVSLEKPVIKNNHTSLIVSFLIFCFVAGGTGYIYFENSKNQAIINEKTNKIKKLTADITIRQKDRDMMAYKLVEGSRKAIEQQIARSRVDKYIEEMQNIEKKYSISFSGFNYSQEIITTAAIAKSKNSKDAAFGIADMVTDFRDGKDKTYFDLSFIESIRGSEESEREFNVTFHLDEQKVKKLYPKTDSHQTASKSIDTSGKKTDTKKNTAK